MTELKKNEKLGEISSSIMTNIDLEKIDESNELYENTNDEDEDQENLISNLQQKIICLEKMNKDLRSKNENLTKNNIEKSSAMNRMSLVGLRKKFTLSSTFKKVQNDVVKIAEIVKEKDDLQDMNEKMIDLLTEKELEKEDLLQQLEKSKLEAKLENDKNLEKIQNLEDRIVELENTKGTVGDADIDDVITEYNNYKQRIKKQINDYSKNEAELKQQLEMKESAIQKLNKEIQGLELENLQLVNQSERKDKLKEKDYIEIDKLVSENEKIKRELGYLNEQLKLEKQNLEKSNKDHEKELIEYQKRIENEQNNLKTYKENKLTEINLLKSEISRNTRDINIFTKRIEANDKLLEDEKKKNFMIQTQLDKKTKELQDMNEYTKKLLSNKDKLLLEYEEKIEEMTKDKNNLISQNKELLEKLKAKNEEASATTNLADIIDEDNKEELEHVMQENKLLNEEIKELKEQLNLQAKKKIQIK